MLFGRKKRGMIDVGELARRGKVRKDDSALPKYDTNKDGFVDFSKPQVKEKVGGADVSNSSSDNMGFMDLGSSSSGSSSSSNFSSEQDGYSKREVDDKIQKLDSLIYKLEQRIELLERKAGVNSSSSNSGSSSVGVMGW